MSANPDIWDATPLIGPLTWVQWEWLRTLICDARSVGLHGEAEDSFRRALAIGYAPAEAHFAARCEWDL